MEDLMNPIDAYIEQCPTIFHDRLRTLRQVILEEAPMAVERMAYGMPTFTVKTNLVHFALQTKHIGFYPGSSGVEAFEDRLKAYTHSKGTIQFRLDQPLPLELVRDIVRYRLAENLTLEAARKKRKVRVSE
jgi:uncharacterized protein YdhG (YjbR/CyaY superfamily)